MIIDETSDLNEAQRELECARGHVAALERAISAELARRIAAGNIAAHPCSKNPQRATLPSG